MDTDADKWRQKMIGFRSGDTEVDRITAHAKTTKEGKAFEEGCAYSDSADEEQGLKMTKAHQHIFCLKWEPQRSDLENTTIWDEAHASQKGKWDQKGGSKRAMFNHPIEMHTKKKGQATQTWCEAV